MKIKNFFLIDKSFIDSLKYMTQVHLPITISFSLDKCFEVIEKELKHVENKRLEIYKRYAIYVDLGEGKGHYTLEGVSGDNLNSFHQEMNELINIEFNIPIESKFQLSISKLKDVELSIEYLNKLKLLFDFKE